MGDQYAMPRGVSQRSVMIRRAARTEAPANRVRDVQPAAIRPFSPKRVQVEAAEDTKRFAEVVAVVQIDAELPLGRVTIEGRAYIPFGRQGSAPLGTSVGLGGDEAGRQVSSIFWPPPRSAPRLSA
ncbi:MAG: hypothetical protein U0470_07100 [Anaerolineae bacterium]